MNSPISSSTELRPAYTNASTLGDPACPYCGGQGYLRLEVPIGHPEFGRLQICSCRRKEVHYEIHNRLFAMSNLEELRHLTFDTFQPGGHIGLAPNHASSLEMAYNHAQQFAQSQKGWLLLTGGFGCGKTHLAAAIANFAVDMGVPTLFITVPDMLDTLRFAYNDTESGFEQRFDDIRRSPLLILDDFGTQNATPWAQEKLFQILNYRYINRLPLVITTNLSLDDIEGRISSRLQDPQLVTRVMITAPDYRNPTDDTNASSLSSLSLLRGRTFATFSLRKNEKLSLDDQQNLEKAFQAARSFAEKPQGWLVLMGSYGGGKTHLAAAIANYRSDLGYPALFVVVPDLLDHLRAAFDPSSHLSLDRRFEEVRTAPLLILDDLGTQSSTPWAREKLYQLFNYRYNADLPTVITTADKMEEIDPRIRSRMMDRRVCRIFGITAPSFTGAAPAERQSAARRKRT